MIDALRDCGKDFGFEVRFDTTMPAGGKTCHFTLWRGSDDEKDAWDRYTEAINKKALERARSAPG